MRVPRIYPVLTVCVALGCTLKQTLQVIAKQANTVTVTLSSLAVRLCGPHTLTQLKFTGDQDLVAFFLLFFGAPITELGPQ